MLAFIVFIDMLGMGIVAPVMPALILEVTHLGLDEAAKISGLILSLYAISQFVCAPIIAGLSDRFGRRPILLLTLLALGLNYLMMAIAGSLSLIIIGRLISGVMGATWAAANACLADTFDKENRGAAFGILGGAGAAGFILGPALGGVFGEIDTRLPFLIAASFALVGATTGYFVLHETLTPPRRRPFRLARANPIGAIKQLSRDKFLLGCLGTVFFLQLSAQAHLTIWAFYGTFKFNWTPAISGLAIAVYGITLALVQAILTRKSIARFGAAMTAKFAILLGVPSYLIIAFAPTTMIVLLGVMIGCVIGMTFPALQSLMTAKVPEDAQGELQGALASTISLTSIIGPLLMSHVFASFSSGTGIIFPGAPFVLSSLFLLVAIGFVWRTLRGV